MYAVVVTGGKQYKVSENDYIKVEKLDVNVGDKVELDAIMVCNEGNVTLNKSKVTCEVLRQDKEKKIIIFKMKSKKNERRKNGHRQPYTLLKVLSVKA
ncbi:MAG: 50S ribosomal protein L21 [Clostridia bacterium]